MFRREDISRIALGFVLALVITAPFIVVLAEFPSFSFPLTSEAAAVIVSTVLQASLSAAFSVVFGLIGSFGLLACEERTARLGKLAALAPNAVPVLLLLIAVMKFFPWAKGLAGIVFVHVLLNSGLLSVVFADVVRTKVKPYAEAAWIEGASGPRFFMRVALPLLKADIGLAFLFVFALCFASFAVPLAIGGGRATTIEVLIYEKIRLGGDWSGAVGLAFLQTIAVLVFTCFLGRRSDASPISRASGATPLLSWRPGLGVPLLGALVLAVGLLDGFKTGARQAFALAPLVAELPALVAGSVLISLCAGVLIVLFLLSIAYVRPRGLFRRGMAGYAAPSSVLVGFAILIIWRDLGLATYFKIAIAIALVVVPSFLRFRWFALLDSLEGQVTLARTLGAGEGLIFRRIVFPQVIRPASFLGGVAGLWAWGDFALSSVIAERSVSVAMAVNGLMSAYRLDAATFLVWFVIVGGFGTFGLFVGVGNVLGQKPEA